MININLKTSVKLLKPQQVRVTLSERLPLHIVSDCELCCDYFVKQTPDYTLLTLDVTGILPICCMRCCEIFQFNYENHTEIALCRDEETAESWMDTYDCIVYNQDEVDLIPILTDELHLYAPEKHPNPIDCHSKIQFPLENSE